MGNFKVALVGLNGQAVPDWVTERFVREGIQFAAKQCKSRQDLAETAGDADVVWVLGDHECVYAENLDVIPRCGAIIRTGSGTDNIPVVEATKRGIVVANTPEAISEIVADHAIGLLFAVTRQTSAADRLMRQGVWDREHFWPNWHLSGQTLGLIGFGHIARSVARKLRGWDMTILAHDPVVGADVMESYGVQAAGLDDLLSRADFVSVHCPLLPSTHHLINERTLRLMKQSAVLINTSRGPVVDEPVLIRALTEGWIAAAGLDVFEQEPIDPDNPLLKLDNVVVTPHIGSASDIFWHSFWQASVETAVDLSKGCWPRSYVNRDVKPRWNLT